VRPARVAGAPGWLLARPLLLVSWLSLANACRRRRWLLPAAGVLAVIACWLATRAQFGLALTSAADHWETAFVVLCVQAIISTMRRRTGLHSGQQHSWLAALPVPASVGTRLALRSLAQLLALGVLLLIALTSGTISAASAGTLMLACAAAYAIGTLAGWFLWRVPVRRTPDSHYAVVRGVRPKWASAPSLEPLSYWPVAQISVLMKPKVTARVLIVLLLGLPMGIHAGEALGLAAAWLALLYFSVVTLTLVRVAFTAARWLAPTSVDVRRFASSLGYRAILNQGVTGAVVFLCLLELRWERAAQGGLLLTGSFVIMSAALLAVASAWAFRPQLVARGVVSERAK
jgi:hypothetical protein